MDDQQQHELAELRARAYGPDPDIHDDPSALNRLRDLEELARGATPVTPEPPVEPSLPPKPPLPPPPPSTMLAATPLPDAPTDAPTDARQIPAPREAPQPGGAGPTGRDRRRPWSRKRVALTWLASLGVAVLITATVTGFVSRRIQADPREIAVLGVDSFAEWPELFGAYSEDGERQQGIPEGALIFEGFHGMTAYRMPNGMYSYSADQSCLVLVEASQIDEDSNGYSGTYFNGCSAGIFPATVEIVVTSEPSDYLPEEMLDAFPEGTALQFVLDGDEVVVLSDQD